MPATNGVLANGVHLNGTTTHSPDPRPNDVGILAMEMYFPYRVRPLVQFASFNLF